jgi:hypothetical protein
MRYTELFTFTAHLYFSQYKQNIGAAAVRVLWFKYDMACNSVMFRAQRQRWNNVIGEQLVVAL